MTYSSDTLYVTKKGGKKLIELKQDKKDYKKVNKTRKSRGYNFEYSLVNAFNDHKSKQWSARRLGGSSTGLPDIVITNKKKSLLYVMECKSADQAQIYIPKDQIERCDDIICNFLSIFKNKYYVFAFKFKGNKKKGTKLQYRIIITPTFIISKNLKGISYHIKRDQLIIHYTDMDSIVIKKSENTDIEFLTSIDQFLNWIL